MQHPILMFVFLLIGGFWQSYKQYKKGYSFLKPNCVVYAIKNWAVFCERVENWKAYLRFLVSHKIKK